MSETSLPEVFIIESLNFDDEDARKEGEIIYRTLKMSGKNPLYHYVRTKQELEHFISEFRKSNYRYSHLSCHGNVDTFGLTLDTLDGDEMADILGDSLDRKRLFLSTCLAADMNFANKIFKRSTCFSVAGPAGKIAFDDSAVTWIAFYHLMFKSRPDAMNHKRIMLNLGKSALVLDQNMRVFRRTGKGQCEQQLLPPERKRLNESDVD